MPSITSWSSVRMAKHIIISMTAHDSPRDSVSFLLPNVGDTKYFHEITHYMFKMIQVRHILSAKDEWEILSAISSGDIIDDLE